MSNNYVRKTDNPKMGWSDERRAKYSKQCNEARANGTWHKKSKKAVGLAISNGKREAIKRKNRSEGQKKRHAVAKAVQNYPTTTFSENLLDSASLPNEDVVIKPKEKSLRSITDLFPVKQLGAILALFDLIEDNLGVRPDFNEFISSAVEEKLAKITKAFRKN